MKKGIFFALGLSIGAVGAAVITGNLSKKKIDEKDRKVDKFKQYYNVLIQWLELKQKGKKLDDFFVKNSIKTVAIYGMGEMGTRLYEELKNGNVEVKYAIDKNADSTYSELKVIETEDIRDDVDAIVVSAIFAFDEIREELEKKVNCQILSLDDIVYSI